MTGPGFHTFPFHTVFAKHTQFFLLLPSVSEDKRESLLRAPEHPGAAPGAGLRSGFLWPQPCTSEKDGTAVIGSRFCHTVYLLFTSYHMGLREGTVGQRQ